MNSSTRLPLVALPALLLGLTACTPTVPADEEVYASASDAPVDPAPGVTPNPIEPDTVLIVRATATAENGAVLDLELQVHQPAPWDYTGTQTLPAAIIEDCAGSLTEATVQDQKWSFTRINLTAIPAAGSTADWPTDGRIDVRPSAQYAMIAGRGMLAIEAVDAAPLCLTDKFFLGEGRGALALGVPGDAAGLVGWVNHTYGFTLATGSLGDCSFEMTELGTTLGGGGSAWAETVDATTCVAGASSEAKEY